jgi:hypothetical protein
MTRVLDEPFRHLMTSQEQFAVPPGPGGMPVREGDVRPATSVAVRQEALQPPEDAVPGRRVIEADFPPGYGLRCKGNADSLRNDPLYAPYAAEYLWNEDQGR